MSYIYDMGVGVMIVETYKIGESIIHIDDDSYINRTPEEIAQVIHNLESVLEKIYDQKGHILHEFN